MPEKKLGVLVHGAGWVAGEHIKSFGANPHTRVVAISSRKLESCRKRAAEVRKHISAASLCLGLNGHGLCPQ
jgi:hypothetical protein